MEIQKDLLKMADPAYKAFQCRLMPTVAPERVIGVRVPALRAYARKIKSDTGHFLTTLPHEYYEENDLHAFLLSDEQDFDTCIRLLEAFLPYVDNWATCDGLRPKCFGKNRDKLLPHIRRWLRAEHTYTVRFAVEMLMVHYLEEDFREEYLQWVADIRSEEYYINMMLAWYFATALAKQWDHAVVCLQQRRLSPWVHKKTVQKARESYRITPEQKQYLRTL